MSCATAYVGTGVSIIGGHRVMGHSCALCTCGDLGVLYNNYYLIYKFACNFRKDAGN